MATIPCARDLPVNDTLEHSTKTEMNTNHFKVTENSKIDRLGITIVVLTVGLLHIFTVCITISPLELCS